MTMKKQKNLRRLNWIGGQTTSLWAPSTRLKPALPDTKVPRKKVEKLVSSTLISSVWWASTTQWAPKWSLSILPCKKTQKKTWLGSTYACSLNWHYPMAPTSPTRATSTSFYAMPRILTTARAAIGRSTRRSWLAGTSQSVELLSRRLSWWWANSLCMAKWGPNFSRLQRLSSRNATSKTPKSSKTSTTHQISSAQRASETSRNSRPVWISSRFSDCPTLVSLPW